MSNRLLAIAGALLLSVSGVGAETLPLPQNLVDLTSEAGEHLLLESGVRAYFPLSINFVTQKTQAYCGVASIVMVLNALRTPAPSTPEYEPYHTFTQDNVLDARTEAILPRAALNQQGMTLDQLGQLLETNAVTAEVHHAEVGGLEAFRTSASQALAMPDHYVVVNYLRSAIGQQSGGHISPLAAYDTTADRFLILDVARYKYPPVWVSTADLYQAMSTTDAGNQNRTRGYVLVSRAAQPTAN